MNIEYNQEEAAAEEQGNGATGEGDKLTTEDRDLRLFRCLQSCTPPSGSFCIVNQQRTGRLMMGKGFIEDDGKSPQSAAFAEQDEPISSLPLGKLLTDNLAVKFSYVVSQSHPLVWTGQVREVYFVSPRGNSHEESSLEAEVS